jgi:hypothetical protein
MKSALNGIIPGFVKEKGNRGNRVWYEMDHHEKESIGLEGMACIEGVFFFGGGGHVCG